MSLTKPLPEAKQFFGGSKEDDERQDDNDGPDDADDVIRILFRFRFRLVRLHFRFGLADVDVRLGVGDGQEDGGFHRLKDKSIGEVIFWETARAIEMLQFKYCNLI